MLCVWCALPPAQIDSARGRATAEEFGIKFWETSAKDGTNVSKAFQGIAKEIVERMVAGPPSAPHEPAAAGSVSVSDVKVDPGDKKRCSLM